MTKTTTLVATPVISIARAFCGSRSLFTSQAITPPSHPMKIGSSHQAPLTALAGGREDGREASAAPPSAGR